MGTGRSGFKSNRKKFFRWIGKTALNTRFIEVVGEGGEGWVRIRNIVLLAMGANIMVLNKMIIKAVMEIVGLTNEVVVM